MCCSEQSSKLELKHSIQNNPNGSVNHTGVALSTQKEVAPGTVVGGSVGIDKREASSGAISDMKTAGLFGSQVSSLGKTSIGFTDKTGSGPAGREHHTDLTLGHAFPIGANAVVAATVGHETHHVGPSSAKGMALGLQGRLDSAFGTTTGTLKDTSLSGLGISEHHQSGTLRHDLGIGNSKIGGSVFQEAHSVGSIASTAQGYGLHASTLTGAGTTGINFTDKTTFSPFGVGSLQSTSLTHNIPLSKDTFLEGFASHDIHTMPGGKSFGSDTFGMSFGMKF